MLKLKERHMTQQTQLVKEINSMAHESKKIIDDITVIETEIEKYQVHIDQWIKKIEDVSSAVEKIRGVEKPFKIKASNVSKLKDYLMKEVKKNK